MSKGALLSGAGARRLAILRARIFGDVVKNTSDRLVRVCDPECVSVCVRVVTGEWWCCCPNVLGSVLWWNGILPTTRHCCSDWKVSGYITMNTTPLSDKWPLSVKTEARAHQTKVSQRLLPLLTTLYCTVLLLCRGRKTKEEKEEITHYRSVFIMTYVVIAILSFHKPLFCSSVSLFVAFAEPAVSTVKTNTLWPASPWRAAWWREPLPFRIADSKLVGWTEKSCYCWRGINCNTSWVKCKQDAIIMPDYTTEHWLSSTTHNGNWLELRTRYSNSSLSQCPVVVQHWSCTTVKSGDNQHSLLYQP